MLIEIESSPAKLAN